jgi:hypothetical protein
MWVAACCLTHGIPLATLNLKDYEDFNQHQACASSAGNSRTRHVGRVGLEPATGGL